MRIPTRAISAMSIAAFLGVSASAAAPRVGAHLHGWHGHAGLHRWSGGIRRPPLGLGVASGLNGGGTAPNGGGTAPSVPTPMTPPSSVAVPAYNGCYQIQPEYDANGAYVANACGP